MECGFDFEFVDTLARQERIVSCVNSLGPHEENYLRVLETPFMIALDAAHGPRPGA